VAFNFAIWNDLKGETYPKITSSRIKWNCEDSTLHDVRLYKRTVGKLGDKKLKKMLKRRPPYFDLEDLTPVVYIVRR
jgi:hypothetical protein